MDDTKTVAEPAAVAPSRAPKPDADETAGTLIIIDETELED